MSWQQHITGLQLTVNQPGTVQSTRLRVGSSGQANTTIEDTAHPSAAYFQSQYHPRPGNDMTLMHNYIEQTDSEGPRKRMRFTSSSSLASASDPNTSSNFPMEPTPDMESSSYVSLRPLPHQPAPTTSSLSSSTVASQLNPNISQSFPYNTTAYVAAPMHPNAPQRLPASKLSSLSLASSSISARRSNITHFPTGGLTSQLASLAEFLQPSGFYHISPPTKTDRQNPVSQRSNTVPVLLSSMLPSYHRPSGIPNHASPGASLVQDAPIHGQFQQQGNTEIHYNLHNSQNVVQQRNNARLPPNPCVQQPLLTQPSSEMSPAIEHGANLIMRLITEKVEAGNLRSGKRQTVDVGIQVDLVEINSDETKNTHTAQSTLDSEHATWVKDKQSLQDEIRWLMEELSKRDVKQEMELKDLDEEPMKSIRKIQDESTKAKVEFESLRMRVKVNSEIMEKAAKAHKAEKQRFMAELEALRKQLSENLETAELIRRSFENDIKRMKDETKSVKLALVEKIKELNESRRVHEDKQSRSRNELQSVQKELVEGNEIMRSLEADVEKMKRRIETLQGIIASKTRISIEFRVYYEFEKTKMENQVEVLHRILSATLELARQSQQVYESEKNGMQLMLETARNELTMSLTMAGKYRQAHETYSKKEITQDSLQQQVLTTSEAAEKAHQTYESHKEDVKPDLGYFWQDLSQKLQKAEEAQQEFRVENKELKGELNAVTEALEFESNKTIQIQTEMDIERKKADIVRKYYDIKKEYWMSMIKELEFKLQIEIQGSLEDGNKPNSIRQTEGEWKVQYHANLEEEFRQKKEALEGNYAKKLVKFNVIEEQLTAELDKYQTHCKLLKKENVKTKAQATHLEKIMTTIRGRINDLGEKVSLTTLDERHAC